MAHQVPWNKIILEEFIRLAILTKDEEAVMRTRVAGCNENQPINRYELDLVQKNAKLESDIALRDANTYNDQKTLEMYKYIDGRLRGIEEVQAAQAVHNQKTEDASCWPGRTLPLCVTA